MGARCGSDRGDGRQRLAGAGSSLSLTGSTYQVPEGMLTLAYNFHTRANPIFGRFQVGDVASGTT